MLGNSEILHVETVDSTNSLVKKLIQENSQRARDGLVVVADAQTAGRGRLTGRTWISPPKAGLLCSIAIPTHRYPCPGTQPLPLVVGIILARTIESLCTKQNLSVQVELKWPNDLYVQGRKLSGILIETEGDYSIIGIGINLNTEEFPPELRHKATSLKILTGRDWDSSQVLAELLRMMDETLHHWQQTSGPAWDSLLGEYRRRDFLKGKKLSLLVGSQATQKPVSVMAQGIADDGALMVCDPEGVSSKIYSGEISLD